MRAPRPQAAAILAATAVLLAAGTAPPAGAQPARLLADVSDRPLDHPSRLLLPPSTVVLDGVSYFSHDDGVAGQELWRSDGTEAGTWRVRDICPGRCWGNVQEITVVGDRLFFSADDGVHGQELWLSDGTAEGTRLAADVTPGLRWSRPTWITAFGDRVFFAADDGVHGLEPWISDGTAAGTVRLGDLLPGTAGSEPSGALALGDRLLFFANDGVHGREPWITDGTPAGTELLFDVRPGAASSVGGHFTPAIFPQVVGFGGKAWFVADDGAHGRELWKSDGTPSGTVIAADLAPGAASSEPHRLVATAQRLYFDAEHPTVGQELFSTDGGDPSLVADLAPGPASSFPRLLAPLAGELYFIARRDGVDGLWRTDGSTAGTVLVRDVWAEADEDFGWASLWPATAAGGQLFFAAGSGAGDSTELWRTDGTTDGTRLVKDIWPGAESALFPLFTFARPVEIDDRLLFFAAHPEIGWEPWISDGSEAGTSPVRDIFITPSSQAPFLGLDFAFPIDADGRLYFRATTGDRANELWTSRGTPQSTRRVEGLSAQDGGRSYSWPVGWSGRRLVFAAHDAGGTEIWSTDSEGATASFLSAVEWSNGFGTSFAGRAYFHAEDDSGHRLWGSDGSPEITGPLIDEADFTASWLLSFAEVAARLYFRAGTAAAGDELWSTDGTPEGTSLVRDLRPGPASGEPQHFTASGDRLFFSAHLPETGQELWTSDGTEAGTIPLPEVRPGPESGFVDGAINGNLGALTMSALPGGVAFVGDDGVHGEEPWWSDGVGVMPIGDLRPGARGSEPRWLTSTGDTLFFVADDGVHGRELWRWRPGEAAAMVADLVPGQGSSLPQELAAVDGLLYFSAFTPETGVELWRSDGTAAGTVMLQDIWPGEESSTPSRLTASGRYLFFTADDGTHGREMWSLLLPTRRPRAFLTASGSLVPGGQVILTLRLENPPPEELPDGDGDELSLPLPAVLEPLEVTATSGTVAVMAAGAAPSGAGRRSSAAAAGGSVVTWNGSLPAGGAVEVTIVARVSAATSAGVTLQAIGTFDSDGDGSNDEGFTSDDPTRPGADDATFLPLVVEIPALRSTGLALLAAALALLALLRLRRATV